MVVQQNYKNLLVNLVKVRELVSQDLRQTKYEYTLPRQYNPVESTTSLVETQKAAFENSSNIDNDLININNELPHDGYHITTILVVLVLMFIILGTIVGNILVCVAVCMVKKLRRPYNYLLVNFIQIQLQNIYSEILVYNRLGTIYLVL